VIPLTRKSGLAFSYIRCSTPEQIKGDTKRRQIEAAEKYARENGLILSEDGYEDLGISAFRGKNTAEGSELAALIAAIKAGKIPKGSTLIIENLDRLSRNFITESLPLFMDIIRCGVTIVTLMDRKVYSQESIRKNPFDLMYSIMILARGHEESAAKSERIQAAWSTAQKNANTVKIRQSYPAWLELRDNKFKVLAVNASVIQNIYKQYLDGKGTGAIARDLNTRGIPTFTGKKWYQTTVKFYLRFPAAIGEYHVGKREAGKKVKTGQVVKDYYPRIIEEADYYRAQAKLTLNPSRIGRPQRPDANLFSGIIKCGYCGGSMGIYNAAKSNSFVCWNGVAGGCVRVAYPAEEIERNLTWALKTILADWAASKGDAAMVEQLAGRITEIDEKMRKMVAVIEAGADVAPVVTRLRELTAEKSKLSAAMETQKSLNRVVQDTHVWQHASIYKPDPQVRLSLIPHIRRHVKCIRVYAVGDSPDAYKRRMQDFAERGIKGSRCYHGVRKELDVDIRCYFTVELHHPITVDGQTGSLLKLGMHGENELLNP